MGTWWQHSANTLGTRELISKILRVPLSIIFIFLKEPFDWPITNIFITYAIPKHRSLNMLCSASHASLWGAPRNHPHPPCFYKLCTWKLNHGQSIWYKKQNVMGEYLKEHIGNILGTPWECGGNRHHPHPLPGPKPTKCGFLNKYHS